MATTKTQTQTDTSTPPAPLDQFKVVPVFTPEQAAQLLDLLGLPADTTDPDLIVATVADLIAQAETAQKPSEVAAAAKRQGFDLVDLDTLAALRHDAAEGRTMKAAAERQKVEDTVTRAIAAGKIGPGRQRHWVDLITADPAMADVLASVPDNTMPLVEIGHGIDGDGVPPSGDNWLY